MKYFIELYLGALVLWISFYFIGKILFNKKPKIKLSKLYICIIIFSLALSYLNFINAELLHGVIKILCVYGLYCAYYKLIFNKTWSEIFAASLILFIFLCASEVIIALVASAVLKNIESLALLKNTLLINTLVSILVLTLIQLSKNKLSSFVKNNRLTSNIKFVIIIIVLLITLALIGFNLPVAKWNLNIEFIVTMVMLLFFCGVGIIIIKQNSEIQKTMSMYQQLVQYSEVTNNLLEDYRIVSHEHKNQLSIIRGMIDNNNKELIEYLDNLLEKRNIIKYQWINELNHLPLSGLKGLINYKLMEMENEKINLSITISKDLLRSKIKKLPSKQKDNLYSILGVYLDNAIQASKNSKKKEVSIEIFKEKNYVIFILANTYEGKIELENLDDYGYTTKGKHHGVGLNIVKRILDEQLIFSQKRMLFQDYYVEELRIDLNYIK